MSSKRKKRWPRGFYSDGTSYRMKTANGRFRRLGSNEARALRKFHQVRRLENGGDSAGAPASPRMTLRTVAERWLEAQKADGVRDADRDFGRFKNHVDPLIGSKRIGDIEARDLMLMIRELKRQKKANGSPRHADGSIVNILGVCSSVFELAILEGAIEHNPVKHIPSRKRPKKRGKGGIPYRHHEAVALMTDLRVPADRRILNTLQALTGMRIGEACGRRWRDYDRETPGLGALHVWSQYDDQPLKTGRAAHEKERFVPVHPVLAKALAEWRLGGFVEAYGRPPSGDDFIVPDPATMGARTQNKAGKGHRADAELLGIYVPGRLTHGLRRWFISTCRNASARTEVVELMTHNAKGEVIDAYTSWEWSTLCGELTKLEVDLNPAKLIVLPVAKSETRETTAVSHQVFASDFATRDQSEMIPSAYWWRRWESNPERSDTLTLRGHSVFPRIAMLSTPSALLPEYPAIPWNPPDCPGLWSLFGH